MKKYLLILLLLFLSATALYFFPSWNGDTGKTRWLIAIVQLTEVDSSTQQGFKTAMKTLGYQENQDLTYLSSGFAGRVERLDKMILEHLKQKPDLFMVSSTPATLAVKRLTADLNIPVVFAPVNDPVAAGIVADLKQPDGMITGIRLPTGDDLRLHWLTQIVPGCKRVFVPYHANDKSAQTSIAQIKRVAPQLGLELILEDVQQASNIPAVIAAMPVNIDAIFLPRDSRVEAAIAKFVSAARSRQLPISAPSLIQVQQGALFSYGFVHYDIGRQAARLVDQIIKGVAPGDLPVEMAENTLSLNLATASALGIIIPDKILLQAEHIVRE
ncbi:ABC transporter substrate-binding protein [Candidatus Venteria ishoeyi]|uniref:ABC transporter substrate-binding protein n=1 Tax=Candidatus Venteria ishoeyi TaxID=1899563 RepID=UPI0025A5E531|nr:ABC transporter substrate-binding protein [Candidatus Venteria ishoeyi]MDM8545156.1 ABC transporter substrate-binding protein [Candidatus Venteria ishoeyi]